MRSASSTASSAAAALLCLALFATAMPAPAAVGPWLRLDTKHFTFFTDGPEDVARSTAYDLEQMRYVLTQLWPDSRLDPAVPTLIYLFADVDSFRPYRLGEEAADADAVRDLEDLDASDTTAGYLVPHEHGKYAALMVYAEARPVGFVYKQYVHQLLQDKLPGLPLWLRHGFAELYSTFEVAGDEALIGLPIESHRDRLLWYLRHEKRLPLAPLLTGGELPGAPDRPVPFFELSWALVHYLNSEPKLRRQLGAFARATAGGAPHAEAFATSFAVDVDALEKRLADYLRGTRFNYLRVKIDRGAHPALVKPLAAHQALYHLGDLLAHAHPERRDEARAHFQRALELAPEHGPSHADLGYLAELAGDDAAALGHYERAIELNAGNFLVQYLYGASCVRSFGDRRPATEEETARLERAITALERSVERWADFAPAWSRLGFAYNLRPEASPRAVEALEKALELLPGRHDVAFNLLLAYARVDQREAADAVVARMRRLGADDATLERAREVLLTMDYRDAARLVRQERLDDAVALFARIQAESRQPALQQQAAAQLEKLASTAQALRFSNLYRQAVDHLAARRTEEAAAVLRDLGPLAKPGRQQEAVAKLLAAVTAQRQGGG